MDRGNRGRACEPAPTRGEVSWGGSTSRTPVTSAARHGCFLVAIAVCRDRIGPRRAPQVLNEGKIGTLLYALHFVASGCTTLKISSLIQQCSSSQTFPRLLHVPAPCGALPTHKKLGLVRLKRDVTTNLISTKI
jgi:hypothetical protein